MPIITETNWGAELTELLREFYPAGDDPEITFALSAAEPRNIIRIGEKEFKFASVFDNTRENLAKRNAKIALYDALAAYTGKSLPWGSLTGIRPTKLFYEAVRLGMDYSSAERFMTDVYRVSDKKAAVLKRIALAQQGEPYANTAVNLYVHIPFCTSRCSYCSFISLDAHRQKKLIAPYVDQLVEELQHARRFLADHSYTVFSVYVGGGTPTAVPSDALERILSAARYDCEFTCEAGRPDTIDGEVLDVMKRCGVNRVSVNPQSLVESTLQAIGRSHTVDDFYRAYERTKQYDFVINTDIIAGLPGEGLEAFAETLSGVMRLRPDNVTVHTLSVKNGSALRALPYAPVAEIEEMTDLSAMMLSAAGYQPYYLYRQKHMQGNLENVGYTLPGRRCDNNITTMEDALSVFACGAGAISKRVYPAENRIERLANLRDVGLYLRDFDARLKKKEKFFSGQ